MHPAGPTGSDVEAGPDPDHANSPGSATDPAANLTAEELRVLACLIEKANTTPEQYPLSTNALTAACNQKTSRDPVVEYPANLVDRTIQLLRDGGWARSIRGSGNRTFKHRHVIDEKLGLDSPEQAVISVLALRGPQSPGELKTRTERYHDFADLEDVERVLGRLAARQPPLVRDVGRAPGQSQDRWIQLIGPSPGAEPGSDPAPSSVTAPAATPSQTPAPSPASSPAPTSGEAGARPVGLPPAGGGGGGDADEVVRLRARVEALERRLGDLERELGLEP